MGRDFLPEEEQPGKNHVVVLTNKLWKRFGADPKILGKPMRLNNIPYTIVGVWIRVRHQDRGDIRLDMPMASSRNQASHQLPLAVP